MTRKVFNDFTATIDAVGMCLFRLHQKQKEILILIFKFVFFAKDPLKCLEIPILVRSSVRPDQLEATFPGSILSLINELEHWVALGIEIPHYAAEAYRRKSELRHLREITLVMVREYNRIVSVLSSEEKALFQERIKMLDKRIGPGFMKIQWPVKSMVEFFVSDSRLHICNLQVKVDEYKLANAGIRENCEAIAKTLLLKLEPGRIYENDDFNEEQVGNQKL